MYLIPKSELSIVGNRMVNTDSGEVVSLPQLAFEYDEILEIQELVAFVNNNAADIEASGSEPIEYSRDLAAPPSITPVESAPTPLRDADVEEKKAYALEFLAHQETEDINTHLLRYNTLAAFFVNEFVELDLIGDGRPSEFNGNIFDLTEQDVIDAVVAFHDPEFVKLRKMLVIKSS